MRAPKSKLDLIESFGNNASVCGINSNVALKGRTPFGYQD